MSHPLFNPNHFAEDQKKAKEITKKKYDYVNYYHNAS